MKKLIITTILALLVAAGTTIKAQDRPAEYLGLPGDNLNLYAVMNLFQKSETLEDFERSLNDPESRINNLDLNGDNLVDYITVTDYVDDDVHNIVLQVALTRNEKQDVGVFTVQRFRNESVQIQLIGDEALYGRNYIIEPIYDDNVAETPNPGYYGNRDNITVVRTTTYQVAAWPVVRFIYRPGYTVWHSSWYWGYYPSYWHAWNPFYWDYYYGYHHNWYPEYYSHYRHWEHPRYGRYNDFYYSNHRSHSTEVNIRINNGHYKNTYSHPEQRRDGEALYSKTHSDRPSTTTSGTTRRSTNMDSGQPRSNRSKDQSTGTSRRSNNTVTGRSNKENSSVQNAGTSRRSNNTVTDRSNTSHSSGQKTEISKRSSPSSTEGSVSKPATSRRSENARTSGRSSTNSGTTKSSNTRVSKKESSTKRTEKSKSSDTKDSSRRK